MQKEIHSPVFPSAKSWLGVEHTRNSCLSLHPPPPRPHPTCGVRTSVYDTRRDWTRGSGSVYFYKPRDCGNCERLLYYQNNSDSFSNYRKSNAETSGLWIQLPVYRKCTRPRSELNRTQRMPSAKLRLGEILPTSCPGLLQQINVKTKKERGWRKS